ncbi:MAG: hypothetical protein JXL97_03600, partial [Bacteroidales bacterium]|nr:hypothetical protein [Bacteroidales bacterium]
MRGVLKVFFLISFLFTIIFSTSITSAVLCSSMACDDSINTLFCYKDQDGDGFAASIYPRCYPYESMDILCTCPAGYTSVPFKTQMDTVDGEIPESVIDCDDTDPNVLACLLEDSTPTIDGFCEGTY